MKLRKLIPITALSTMAIGMAPIGLTSCSKYQYVNILNGFTPSTPAREAKQFEDYSEVCQYYKGLDKSVLAEDYLWSLSEYVKENMEFPEPVFPFRFTKIETANITLENWWTQTYSDESRKDLFSTSFSINFKLSGTTEPRQEYNGPVGAYLPYSNVVCSLTMHVYKMPYTIINSTVDSSNKTDAVWVVRPADVDVLEKDTVWNVSDVCEMNYILQAELEHSVTTTDTLSIYWHSSNLYEPIKQKDQSQLLSFSYDALRYGSYHLKNCTLKA